MCAKLAHILAQVNRCCKAIYSEHVKFIEEKQYTSPQLPPPPYSNNNIKTCELKVLSLQFDEIFEDSYAQT